jgi:flagellum-specific peptidoglycan hydrolase FlgJ
MLTPEGRAAFIASLVSPAQSAQKVFGIPASVTIAQAIIESSWGESSLASLAKNYFGIKAHGLYKSIVMPTHEVVDGQSVQITTLFAKYDDIVDSFADHGELLSTRQRYAPVLTLKNDPLAFARALGPERRVKNLLWSETERRIKIEPRCGYSTNPEYGALIAKVISSYDLTQYDTP